MDWFQKYIGMPYKNHNCIEFVALVLKKEFNIDICKVPRVGSEVEELSKAIDDHQEDFVFEENYIDNPEDLMGVIMKCRGKYNHVGLYIRHNNRDYVLHCINNFGYSVLHEFDKLKMFQMEVVGVYKWRK